MSLLKALKNRIKLESEKSSTKSTDSNSLSITNRTIDFEFNNFTTNFEPVVLGTIPTILYQRDFICHEYEAYLIQSIFNEDETNSHTWVTLKTRKLQCYEGSVQFPQWLTVLTDALIRANVFDEVNRPNHVLINYYAPGQGILHHVDGPKYLDRVAILSLCSSTLMTFRKKLDADQIGIEFDGDLFSIILQSCSLLVFTNEIYTDYMHGIASDVTYDTIGMSSYNQSKYDSTSTDDTSYKDCKCLNKDICNMCDGDVINRNDKRVSLTFRCSI